MIRFHISGGIIAELGFDYKAIEYTQPKRRAGKSKNNFYSLYDYAMIGITSYSKVVMRLATFAGFIIGGLSLVAAIVYLVLKLMYWDSFFGRCCTYGHRHVLPWGTAAVLYWFPWRICAQYQQQGS